MLTPSWIDTWLLHDQFPLFPGASRVDEILTIPDNEYGRVFRLLNDWADKYGKVLIRVDETAILVGEYRIALEDISPKNALQNGIETFKDVSFSPRWNLLTTKPWSIDMVEVEAWMALIDAIPGVWAERRDNLLALLGNECFSHEENFYKAKFSDGYDIFFAYHTNESLGDDDGQYYWQLFIRSLPIPLEARHCSVFIDEYADKYPIDQELRDWGDEYIHFDAFHTSGVYYDAFSAPPAAVRLMG